MQFFDINGNSLTGVVNVPVGTVPGVTFPDQTLSFLGLIANAGEEIARVRITTGTAALGPTDNPSQGVDMVVMDDFIYAEPQAIQVENMANDAYRLGQTGIAAYLLALQATRDVRLGALQAEAELQTALTDLEKAIGAPLER